MLSTLPAPAALARWCVVLSAAFALILTSCDRQPPTASLAPGQAQLAAGLDSADEPIDRETIVRPGIAIVPERTHRIPKDSSISRGTCSVGFLVTDGQHIYGTTVGHCYSSGSGHPTSEGRGFLDYKETILSELDQVYTAEDCDLPRLCSSGLRIGKFVYAHNNNFNDPVDSNPPLGVHNPTVPVGDFALIRLHPRVRWSPKMCHFGGPLTMDKTPYEKTTVVATRFYGIGFAYGYTLANAINQGWTGAAVPGRTPSVWSTPYTFTGTGGADPGSSGGPIMTVDGAALGILGGAHYLDRFNTSLERAGHYLGKNFTLLTVTEEDFEKNPTPVGNDPNCQPRKGTALTS